MGHGMDSHGKDEGKNSEHTPWGEQTTSGNKGCEGESHDHCQGKGIKANEDHPDDPSFQDEVTLLPRCV